MYGKEFYRDNPGASKVQDLLYWEGSGVTDPDTMAWTPSESGIYWIDLEVWNVDSMYTDFLTGLDAMSAGISIDNIREVHRTVEADNGTVELSFELNGNGYALDPWTNLDWMDTEIVVQLGQILEDDQDPMDLYVAEDGGQGLYFFYGDEDIIRELSGLTGLKFCLASRLYSLY